MYRLVACDLDETLLCTDCSICERNIRAIEGAIKRGVYFVPATGRGFESVRPVLETLGLYQKKDQYVISFNGGVITENAGNRIVDMDALPFEMASMLYKRGYHQYGLCMHVYTEREVYVYKPDASELAFLKNRLDFVPLESDNIDFLKNRSIIKVLYMYEDYGRLNQIHQALSADVVECEVSYSSNRYIEFNHKGVDKGKGVLRLAKYLGIKPEETIAIGDNINDRAMLRAAGLGAGVANILPSMRNECAVIADSTNNEGGVGEIIEKYILSAGV